MRTLLTLLITSIGIATCWLGSPEHAHGQLAQALNDYKHDRLFQYSPDDPWTRSKLFNRHTKHFGIGYNCDGEECKRNSPYIHWKTHTENDLPACKGLCRRLNETLAEVQQRVADGTCIECDQPSTCQSCQQAQSYGGGYASTTQPTITELPFETTVQEHAAVYEDKQENADSEHRPIAPKPLLSAVKPPQPVRRTKVVKVGGLESLDTRIK